MKVIIGQQELEMGGKYLTELRSANDILDEMDALRNRMKEDGYLLIRGFHDRDKVLKAKRDILEKMQQHGILAEGTDMEDGIIGAENKGMMFGGTNTDLPSFLEVVNSPKAMNFFDQFFGGPSITYDYKWLRAIPKGENTGAHYDIVYMGRGTKNVYTLWTPFGDTPIEKGTLALCLGSQHFEKIKQTYGQMDVDRDNIEGWFSKDPVEIVDRFGGRWATASFEAGDAILFGMHLMHASTNNTTDRYRISSDTRYQLASEPVDERWVGIKPRGHRQEKPGETTTIKEARLKWEVL